MTKSMLFYTMTFVLITVISLYNSNASATIIVDRVDTHIVGGTAELLRLGENHYIETGSNALGETYEQFYFNSYWRVLSPGTVDFEEIISREINAISVYSSVSAWTESYLVNEGFSLSVSSYTEIVNDNPASVPEPSTLVLLSVGLMGVGVMRKRL